MSDNKLVKTIMDAATLTICRRHWLDWKKSRERKLHQRPQQQCHELCKIRCCHGWQHRAEAVSPRSEDSS